MCVVCTEDLFVNLPSGRYSHPNYLNSNNYNNMVAHDIACDDYVSQLRANTGILN